MGKKTFTFQKKNLVFDFSKLPYMGVGASLSWLITFFIIAKENDLTPVISNRKMWIWNVYRSNHIFDKYIDIASSAVIDDATTIPKAFYYTTDFLKAYASTRYPKGLYDILTKKESLKKEFSQKLLRLPNFSKDDPLFMNYPLSKLPEYVCLIRTGDKIQGPWKETNHIPLHSYIAALKKQKCNKDVYFISDCSSSLKLIENWCANNPQPFRIYYSDEIRDPWFGLKHRKCIAKPSEIYQMFLTCIKNFCIMKHCNILIGQNSSFYYRIGQVINTSQHPSFVKLSTFDKFSESYPF